MRIVNAGISVSSILDTEARTSGYGESSSSILSKSNSILVKGSQYKKILKSNPFYNRKKKNFHENSNKKEQSADYITTRDTEVKKLQPFIKGNSSSFLVQKETRIEKRTHLILPTSSLPFVVVGLVGFVLRIFSLAPPAVETE
jgi:hypothetical protein